MKKSVKQVTGSEAPIACEICLKEIPESEGSKSEVDDYVVYFCGLECYEQWSKQKEKKEDK